MHLVLGSNFAAISQQNMAVPVCWAGHGTVMKPGLRWPLSQDLWVYIAADLKQNEKLLSPNSIELCVPHKTQL